MGCGRGVNVAMGVNVSIMGNVSGVVVVATDGGTVAGDGTPQAVRKVKMISRTSASLNFNVSSTLAKEF